MKSEFCQSSIQNFGNVLVETTHNIKKIHNWYVTVERKLKGGEGNITEKCGSVALVEGADAVILDNHLKCMPCVLVVVSADE